MEEGRKMFILVPVFFLPYLSRKRNSSAICTDQWLGRMLPLSSLSFSDCRAANQYKSIKGWDAFPLHKLEEETSGLQPLWARYSLELQGNISSIGENRWYLLHIVLNSSFTGTETSTLFMRLLEHYKFAISLAIESIHRTLFHSGKILFYFLLWVIHSMIHGKPSLKQGKECNWSIGLWTWDTILTWCSVEHNYGALAHFKETRSMKMYF